MLHTSENCFAVQLFIFEKNSINYRTKTATSWGWYEGLIPSIRNTAHIAKFSFGENMKTSPSLLSFHLKQEQKKRLF